jgi:hypothetical protein
MRLDLCIDLQDIPFGIFEEQGTVPVLPAARRFEDLNAFSEQLGVAAIHLSACYAKRELNTGGMRMPGTVISSSTPAQSQQDSAHPHLQPTVPVPVNGKTKEIMIKGPHTLHILTQEYNIIEVANIR